MERPLTPNDAKSPSKKRHVESPNHDALKEFIDYMKNLKAMLVEENALSKEHIPAMCKQLSRHLTSSTIVRYACDQTGSRLIEVIFSELAKRIETPLGKLEAAEAASEGTKTATTSILNLFCDIFVAITEAPNVFTIVLSQYGSHTIESFLRFYSVACRSRDAALAVGCESHVFQKIIDASYSLTQTLYSTSDELRSFWTFVKDLRATHVLRATAKNLVSTDSTRHFQTFIQQLLEDSAKQQKLHSELYWDQQAVLTLQVILSTFAECDLSEDIDCKSVIRENSLPLDDEALKKLLLDKQDSGRRMVEYLIENNFISDLDYKRIFGILLAIEDLEGAIHDQLKPLFHKLLSSRGMTAITNTQMEKLIDCASLEKNTRFLRNLIKAARCNKTHARCMIERLKIIVAKDAGVDIDWEKRRQDFADQILSKIERELNFWYMLMSSPHKGSLHKAAENSSFQFEGVSIASDIISNFKAGYITTELLEELNQLFDRDENDSFDGHCEGSRGRNSVFDELTHSKFGVMFLEQLVQANLPDGIKRVVRLLAGEQIRELCFDPNGSWLVATIVDHAEGKEKNRLYRMLGEIRSELLKRNPALYGRLGPEFLKFLNPGKKSSSARFGAR